MIFITQCDSPALWQTYLSDPASITMEGILIFNKHLLFLLTVIVLFVGWLLFYTIYYFIEYNNKFSSKFVHSKELEIVWTSIPALLLLILSTSSFTSFYEVSLLNGCVNIEIRDLILYFSTIFSTSWAVSVLIGFLTAGFFDRKFGFLGVWYITVSCLLLAFIILFTVFYEVFLLNGCVDIEIRDLIFYFSTIYFSLWTVSVSISSLVTGFFGRKFDSFGASYITVSCLLFAFFISLFVFYEVSLLNCCVYIKLTPWINSEMLNVDWDFMFDSSTVVMCCVVTFVSSIVHLYFKEYMAHDPHLFRFMFYLSLFTFFMLILVTADNFIQMFVGWGGVGLCSYLLINFWFIRIQANKVATKAMVLNRIGDFGLVIAMNTPFLIVTWILFLFVHTLRFLYWMIAFFKLGEAITVCILASLILTFFLLYEVFLKRVLKIIFAHYKSKFEFIVMWCLLSFSNTMTKKWGFLTSDAFIVSIVLKALPYIFWSFILFFCAVLGSGTLEHLLLTFRSSYDWETIDLGVPQVEYSGVFKAPGSVLLFDDVSDNEATRTSRPTGGYILDAPRSADYQQDRWYTMLYPGPYTYTPRACADICTLSGVDFWARIFYPQAEFPIPVNSEVVREIANQAEFWSRTIHPLPVNYAEHWEALVAQLDHWRSTFHPVRTCSVEASEWMAFYGIEEEGLLVPYINLYSRTFHPLVDVVDPIPIQDLSFGSFGTYRDWQGRTQADHLETLREYSVSGTSSRPLLNPWGTRPTVDDYANWIRRAITERDQGLAQPPSPRPPADVFGDWLSHAQADHRTIVRAARAEHLQWREATPHLRTPRWDDLWVNYQWLNESPPKNPWLNHQWIHHAPNPGDICLDDPLYQFWKDKKYDYKHDPIPMASQKRLDYLKEQR